MEIFSFSEEALGFLQVSWMPLEIHLGSGHSLFWHILELIWTARIETEGFCIIFSLRNNAFLESAMVCNYNQISISFWRTAFWRGVLLGKCTYFECCLCQEVSCLLWSFAISPRASNRVLLCWLYGACVGFPMWSGINWYPSMMCALGAELHLKIWWRIIQQYLISGWWQQIWDTGIPFISWHLLRRFECLKHSETKQVKHKNLEQRNLTARPSKENWWLMLGPFWTLWWFSQRSFHRQSLRWGPQGCDFLLIG